MTGSVAGDLALYFLFMIGVTSILSLPLEPATLLAAKIAAPWLVAVLAAAASCISAVFDWHFVRRVFRMKRLVTLRERGIFVRAERMAKVAPFATIAAFAALPVPFTIVRILMPLSGYPLRRYVPAVALGRFPRIYAIAALGAAIEVPTNVLVGLLVGSVVLAAMVALVRRLRRPAEPPEVEAGGAPGAPHAAEATDAPREQSLE